MPSPETVGFDSDWAAMHIRSSPRRMESNMPHGPAWPGAVGPADQALIRPHDGRPDLYAWPWSVLIPFVGTKINTKIASQIVRQWGRIFVV